MTPSPVVYIARFHHRKGRCFEHRHQAGQLFLMRRGSTFLTTPGAQLGVESNWFAWIPAGMEHRVSSAATVQGLTVHIASAFGSKFPAFALARPADQLVGMLLERLAIVSDPGREANLLDVLADEVNGLPSDVPSSCKGLSWQLIEGLRVDPSSRLSLAGWAGAFGVSERTLARRMVVETGRSFLSWRTEFRMDRARSLLASGVSVTETAAAVGYDSLSAFSHRFHSTTGHWPRLYRPDVTLP